MGLLNVSVSPELLADSLNLNASEFGNVQIINAVMEDGSVTLTLRNSNFPGRPESGEIMKGNPIFQRETLKIIDWNIFE